MLFATAAPTPYDLRFNIFGFPVRVHPFFWVVALLLGQTLEPRPALIWVVVVFASVLVHELGHAFAQRAFGASPSIVLYAFGGVSSAYGARDEWWSNVLTAIAGPAAGLALAGTVFGLTTAFGWPSNPLLELALEFLLLINIVWSVVNLLPVWPLDGGHVSRELLVLFLAPSTGIVASLGLSIVIATATAIGLFAMTGSMWNLFLFGFLAYQNYLALVAYRGSRGF